MIWAFDTKLYQIMAYDTKLCHIRAFDTKWCHILLQVPADLVVRTLRALRECIGRHALVAGLEEAEDLRGD